MNNPQTRIKLTVAYDGTNYHGWQTQPGVPTIEGQLNHALTELLGEEITVIGASRTDTGVHALCNIAVFDTKSPIPAEKISYALNQRLPEDIRIQKSEAVTPDFHPRRLSSRKTYHYKIWNADFPLPTKRLYHHFTYRNLDIDQMQKAAEYLVGEHDFASFCTVGHTAETTVRTIFDLNIEKKANEITISITGNGFLYNMVRIIAGTLIDVGTGKYQPDRVNEILLAKDRTLAGPTAPPNGLTLADYDFSSFI